MKASSRRSRINDYKYRCQFLSLFFLSGVWVCLYIHKNFGGGSNGWWWWWWWTAAEMIWRRRYWEKWRKRTEKEGGEEELTTVVVGTPWAFSEEISFRGCRKKLDVKLILKALDLLTTISPPLPQNAFFEVILLFLSHRNQNSGKKKKKIYRNNLFGFQRLSF